MSDALARVRWTIGQILLPEHFRALEGALSRESALRGGSSGLPAYGLTRLAWNGADPSAGVVEVTEVQWLQESGEVLDVPGNARIVQPLELGASKAPSVEVYLHLVDEAPVDDPVASEPSPPDGVPRVTRLLELSADAKLPGSAGYVRLGRFEKATSGPWRASPSVVPPLVHLGPTGYFLDALRSLRADLDAFEGTLLGRLLDADAPTEARWAAQRCRIEARKLGGLLDDLLQGAVPLHPYLLFTALRGFGLDLDLLEGSTAIGDLVRYDHDDLGACMGSVLSTITSRIHSEPPVTPVLRFDREKIGTNDVWLILRNIPAQVLQASELYLLVKKPSAELEVVMKNVPVSAPSRLREVVRRELKPVQLYRQVDSHVVRAFGPWVDVYYVDRQASGAEWQYIERERSIAVFVRGFEESAEMHLYWVASPASAYGARPAQ
ncbi:type VI secretion system baseplate subunit TssK [Myxococcota bacterium]|nr:type VI secretion system baseplate subunit TssK [Myxococcota bacterium]